MKGKYIFLLLSIMLLTVLLAGCGNDLYTVDESALKMDSAVNESTESSQTETVASDSNIGEVSEHESAKDEEEIIEEKTENEEETDEQINIPQDELVPAPGNEEDAEEIPEMLVYSYTEMETVMYASSAVNIRDMPSVDGQRIGSLSAAQEIAVTGQCNETSWYRVDYNGLIGYISNKYLMTEKPVQEIAEIPQSQEVPEVAPQETQTGLVAINDLANKKGLQKKCTDEEFQAAYDAATQIVTPLIDLSREDQLLGIAVALRDMVDSGQVSYSTEEAHYNDPYGYLVLGVASCAGCARTTGLCLNMLGIPYEHVNENQWSHQWCRVNIDGTYWICDAYGLYVGPEPEPYAHPYL